MPRLPFSLSRRSGREFIYVQFKNSQGRYLPAVSTRQTSDAAALETAFKWYREGIPLKKNGRISIPLKEALRDIKNEMDVSYVCEELQRRGLLKTFVLAESPQAVDFGTFLENFWDFDSSPYITEIFQLFVPYYAHKRELNISSASVLLELRQNIMSDVEKLNTHIDYRFNEAFKSPLHHHNGKETENPKQVRK